MSVTLNRPPPQGGQDIARRAGVIRTVRLPNGTQYTGLREDIFQDALKAASDLLRRQTQAGAQAGVQAGAVAMPAASASAGRG